MVTALAEEERTTYSKIIHALNIPKQAFNPYSTWSEDCYTRNCIFESEKFELILLCWEKGQKTPIHDHGGEECWVKVIDGTLKETIYKKDPPTGLVEVTSNISEQGATSYMIDFMGFHTLENISGHRAMSLHLYAKPIKTCNIFNPDTKAFCSKDLSYCSVSQTL